MNQVKIGQMIRDLRRQHGIGQEVLALALGVSVQAVSKWETGASLPDILLLPEIARFFGVSIDALFHGLEEADAFIPDAIPDDGRVRILQFVGRRYLSQEEYDPARPVYLDVQNLPKGQKWDVEIWGSADIQGDVGGGVNAGGNVNCAAVGDGVNCGDIEGGVTAGGNIQCDSIEGNASAGGNIECGDIEGGVTARGDIQCDSIEGNASAGGNIECGDIEGGVTARGDIQCGNIEGDVSAQRDIHCKSIDNAGRIECASLICKKGHIHCEQMLCPNVEDR